MKGKCNGETPIYHFVRNVVGGHAGNKEGDRGDRGLATEEELVGREDFIKIEGRRNGTKGGEIHTKKEAGRRKKWIKQNLQCVQSR